MKTTRRSVLEQTGMATLGMLLPGCHPPTALPRPPATDTDTTMTEYAPKPLPFDPTKLPGLSEKLLRSHHENNYTGAVKKLNRARAELADVGPDTPGFALHGLAQGELAFKHSVVLHELYFGHLVGGGSKGSVTSKLLADRLGDWKERFVAMGKSLGGGSGWTILEFDLHEKVPRMYNAGDHAQGLSSGVPLIVLDMYEHSYHMDYGTKAAKYIDAFFANLHWEEVDRRTAMALELSKMF